ncbi:MAG: biotin--[acetyl-CoA-carboxylase] ligase, partial [Chloroflexi bacterium]|nr:biotin--[acetyl-CoA-carboxylase] ligase [Chloroflexota bacterium]
MEELSAGVIERGLQTRIVGRRVVYYPSVGSTNEVGKEAVRRGAEEGTVIVTEEQTTGKGRLKRAWLTPKGNIALSVLLYPPSERLYHLIMLSSLAVAHTIDKMTGLKSEIKWPNDVLIGSKKVCGILIENDIGNGFVHAVIGIGINVKLDPAASSDFLAAATSLNREAGREISRVDLVRTLLVELDRLYDTLISSPHELYEMWSHRLGTLGKKVRVTSGDEVTEGVAESVGEDGSLRLRLG